MPLAILVLYRISAAQTKRAQWTTTKWLLNSGLREFIEVSATFQTSPDMLLIDDLVLKTDWVLKCYLALRKQVQEQPCEALKATADKLRDHLYDAQVLIDRLVSDPIETRRNTDLIAKRWNYVDSHVRPRVLESGKEWIPQYLYIELQRTVEYEPVRPTRLLQIAEHDQFKYLADQIDSRLQHFLDSDGFTQWSELIGEVLREGMTALNLHNLCGMLRNYVNEL